MEHDQGIGLVTAVVVTRNRADLLLACLDALSAQTRPVDRILVIDNASDDGTGSLDWSRWPQVRYRRCSRNLGGSGGFALGVQLAAQDEDCDWIWLLDDDSICEPDALAALERGLLRDPPAGADTPVLAASRVRWSDGSAHPMNLVAPRYVADPEAFNHWVERGSFPIRACTFVSMLFRRDLVAELGVPLASYFIWGDDIEYTARLLRRRQGIAVADSLVEHRTAKAYGTLDADPDRFFFSVRNQLWTICYSRAYDRQEKFKSLLYLAWCVLRYLSRQRCRPAALGAVVRGLAQGLLGRPREDWRGRPGPLDRDVPGG